MAWTYASVGFLLWCIVNTVGGVALVIARQSPHNRICLNYTIYVITHGTLSIIYMVQDMASMSSQTKNILVGISNLLLMFAATFHFRIGTLLMFRGKQKITRILFLGCWILMLVWMLAFCIVVFGFGLGQYGFLIQFIYYFICATFMIVSIHVAAVRVYRGPNEIQGVYSVRMESSSNVAHGVQSELVDTDEQNQPGIVSCIGRSKLWFYIGVPAGYFGYINFLLPFINALGANIWEATFVARTLDSIFYVPLVIPCFLWVDCPENYQIDKKPFNVKSFLVH